MCNLKKNNRIFYELEIYHCHFFIIKMKTNLNIAFAYCYFYFIVKAFGLQHHSMKRSKKYADLSRIKYFKVKKKV